MEGWAEKAWPKGQRAEGAEGGATLTYEVTLKDNSVERVEGASAYRQEGQIITFYRNRPGRQVIDCWSVPLASYRTAHILKIVGTAREVPLHPVAWTA